MDVSGEVILVSQFTLHASTKKGNRPSYIRAAKPEIAVPLYETFIECFEKIFGKKIQTGRFGADMKVALINDGPVTIVRSEEHTSELQSRPHLVCRLLLEKKKKKNK